MICIWILNIAPIKDFSEVVPVVALSGLKCFKFSKLIQLEKSPLAEYLQFCFSEARKEESGGGICVATVEIFTGRQIPDDSSADGTKAIRVLQAARSVTVLHVSAFKVRIDMEIESDKSM